MTSHRASIVVDLPVRTVYNQWTQFSDFPRFMEGVEEVRQLNDVHLHWRADIGGNQREWDARIVDQQPDRRIAWESTSGARNAGAVAFTPVGPDQTEIDLELEFSPEGLVEQIGDKLGFVGRRVEGDLKRFREFIEQRGTETGAWRGEVHGGATTGHRTGGAIDEMPGQPLDTPMSDRTSDERI